VTPIRCGRRCASSAGQRGQETLQAILVVALVLLPMLVAIITFGTLVHASIATEAAASAGARAAGVAGEFGEAEITRIADELRSNGIDPATCRVQPPPRTVALDEPIPVTVACPQEVGIPFFLQGNVTLSSTVVGRGEVNR
jgi:hypothetical protein